MNYAFEPSPDLMFYEIPVADNDDFDVENKSLLHILLKKNAGVIFYGKKEEQEMHRDERIEQTGQLTLTDNKEETSIHLLTIIGEIEGHDNLGSSSKTTKYEHILPQLAAIEDSKNISGLLVLLNTMGGDVEAGLRLQR